MTQRNTRMLKENVVAYMLITPQLLFSELFLVYPMIERFRPSMFDVSFFNETFCDLDNHGSLFTDLIFYKAVGNTLVMILWTTVITMGVGFFMSLPVFNKGAGYITFVRGSYYTPMIVSMVAYGTTWRWMLNLLFGIIYYILDKSGIHDLDLLGDYRYIFYALVLLTCVINVGQAIVLYVVAMQGISTTLMEPARIDGISRVDILKSIIYPLVRPITLYLVVINIIGMMRVFVVINVTASDGPNYASSSLMCLCYTEAFKSFSQGRASTIGAVMLPVTLMISLVPFRLFRKER